MDSGSVRAAIYCRLSHAIDGDKTKVEDQERICRQLAVKLGWEVHDAYIDNNVSAWKKNVRRPRWEDMLADVAAGKVNGIIVYHGDRMYRQPRDLEKLIDLVEGKGVLVASPTGTRDFRNRDDRAWARMVAAFAENEAAAVSDRRKAQYERMRREGRVRPGGRGGRSFGFDTKGNVIEREAAYIREAASMILEGHGAGEVARWLNGCYLTTSAGKPFTYGTVRKMLARPRFAGLLPDGVTPAAWPAILERGQWEEVCAVLESRAGGFGYATAARRYLLSGIAECGLCGAPMQIWHSKGKGTGAYQTGYRCSECKRLFRSQPHLDAYVAARTAARLSHEGNPVPQVPDTPGLAAEFATLTAARAEAAAAVEDPDQPHVHLLLGRLKRIDERLTQLRDLAGNDARARLLAAHAGISPERFAALPLQVRRSVVAACFTITVLPASRRGPGFRTEDVRLTPL